ncbi:MAG: hypothetical protein SGPRY_006396, partial [Prymnesium sp.]
MPEGLGASPVIGAKDVWFQQNSNEMVASGVHEARPAPAQAAHRSSADLRLAHEAGVHIWNGRAEQQTQRCSHLQSCTCTALPQHSMSNGPAYPADAVSQAFECHPPAVSTGSAEVDRPVGPAMTCAGFNSIQLAMPVHLIPAPGSQQLADRRQADVPFPVASHSITGYLQAYGPMPALPFAHVTPLAAVTQLMPPHLCVAPTANSTGSVPNPALVTAEACPAASTSVIASAVGSASSNASMLEHQSGSKPSTANPSPHQSNMPLSNILPSIMPPSNAPLSNPQQQQHTSQQSHSSHGQSAVRVCEQEMSLPQSQKPNLPSLFNHESKTASLSSDVPPATEGAQSKGNSWQVGDKVEVRCDFDDSLASAWAEATVVEVCDDACVVRCHLDPPQGEKQCRLPHSAIRPRAAAEASAPRLYAAGDPVEAKCDGVWWEAEVIESATMGIESGFVTVHAQVRQLVSGAVRVVDANNLRMRLNHQTALAALARANARSPNCVARSSTSGASAIPNSEGAGGAGGGTGGTGLSVQVPKRQKRASRSADDSFSPTLTPSPGSTPGGTLMSPAERSASSHSLPRASGGSLGGGGGGPRRPSGTTELSGELLPKRDDGSAVVRLTVPQGVTGGQTLLVSLRRAAELVDCSVPIGASKGETMVVYSSVGQAAYVTVPPNLLPGERLLLSIPLPSLPLHVQLPNDAKPGRKIQFVIPSSKLTEQNESDSPAMVLSSDHAKVDSSRERMKDRDRERERCREKKRSIADGSATGSHSSLKRERRSGAAEAGHHSVREEARSRLRRFHVDCMATRTEPLELRELRQLPETLELWLSLEVLRQRLKIPQISLPELEYMLCGLSPTQAVPDKESKFTLVESMHRTLLAGIVSAARSDDQGSQPQAISSDCNWEAALLAAMQSGIWSSTYPDVPLPLLREPDTSEKSHRSSAKTCAWVTEHGPTICGTFGCTLPNNHSGLHKVPETAGSRRRGLLKRDDLVQTASEEGDAAKMAAKVDADSIGTHETPFIITTASQARVSDAISAAALAFRATDALPPPLVPYSDLQPQARLALLSCLCKALMTPAEVSSVQRGGLAAYLGTDGEFGYWGVIRHYRLYRQKLHAFASSNGGSVHGCSMVSTNPQAAVNLEGALPIGSLWTPICLDDSECRRFSVVVSLFCHAASHSANLARRLASKFISYLTSADRRAIQEAIASTQLHEASSIAPVAPSRSAEDRCHAAEASALRSSKSPASSKKALHSDANLPALQSLPASMAGPPGLVVQKRESHGELDNSGSAVMVRASLRACKVPVGHRQLAVRAVLKLSIPRQRRISSTLKWRSKDYANEAEQHKRSNSSIDVMDTEADK